jgi:hypothetical protein
MDSMVFNTVALTVMALVGVAFSIWYARHDNLDVM